MLYDHFNDKIKMMRKNTNDKLRLAAKIHLIKILRNNGTS
jgi:hypothetical protein